MIEELLAYNRKFVEEKRYEQYAASKYPNKKIAILTCMDTPLTELLTAALGFSKMATWELRREKHQERRRGGDQSLWQCDSLPAGGHH